MPVASSARSPPRARVTARAVAAPVVDAVAAAAATAARPPVAVVPGPLVRPARVVAAVAAATRARAAQPVPVVAPAVAVVVRAVARVVVAPAAPAALVAPAVQAVAAARRPSTRRAAVAVQRRSPPAPAPAPAAPADPRRLNRREATCGRLATVERPRVVASQPSRGHVWPPVLIGGPYLVRGVWPFDVRRAAIRGLSTFGGGQARLRERLRPRNSAMI